MLYGPWGTHDPKSGPEYNAIIIYGCDDGGKKFNRNTIYYYIILYYTDLCLSIYEDKS